MRFAEALAQDGFGAIAEFKRRSPSAGDLRPDGDVAQVAELVKLGARFVIAGSDIQYLMKAARDEVAALRKAVAP